LRPLDTTGPAAEASASDPHGGVHPGRLNDFEARHSYQKIQVHATMVAIGDITVGKRHRRDMGDLDALAKSITLVGLLHPIVIDSQCTLIAGERRLRACAEILGWAKIPVTVIDLKEIVRGELAENADRKDFLPSEIEAIRRALAPAIAAETPRGRPSNKGETFPVFEGRARDKLGAFAGVSGRTVEKIAAVVAAAEAQPEKFRHLVANMDRTGKVNGAYRYLLMAKDEERVKGLEVAPGRCRALIIDPPWESDWLSEIARASIGYATMSHEDLLALPVETWAEDNCHLYLWVPNNFMPRGHELLARWGFQHKTVLTWRKAHWGYGAFFRNQTEHVLFGIRGELRTRSDSIGTIFDGPIGDHSEKPESFYDIVRAASFEPFGEAFQRKARPDFRNLFRPKAAAE
jgi:N6-adenosine-specific RNA methylase IME4